MLACTELPLLMRRVNAAGPRYHLENKRPESPRIMGKIALTDSHFSSLASARSSKCSCFAFLVARCTRSSEGGVCGRLCLRHHVWTSLPCGLLRGEGRDALPGRGCAHVGPGWRSPDRSFGFLPETRIFRGIFSKTLHPRTRILVARCARSSNARASHFSSLAALAPRNVVVQFRIVITVKRTVQQKN